MRIIQTIGVLNVFIGVIWLLAPMKFYSAAMALFTPDVSPPFDASAVHTVTFLLLLPAFIFILNGIAIVFIGLKFERVAELKVFKPTGEYVGLVESLEEKNGDIEKFLIGGEEEIKEKDDILAMDDVILLKDDLVSESLEGRRHEFVGMEVYDKRGEYFGRVEFVTLDESQNVTEFLVLRGENKRIIKPEDIESSNDVIIVKPGP
ncbi:MAG: PRC-barrel domain-containing protein [Candidatus Hydrothermarchaeaceae archaeon]